MIVHSAKHYFEAKFPQLEEGEEEIFFDHPTEAIKCNQLGILYFDESVYALYDKAGASVMRKIETATTPRIMLGSKPRIIWECYMGRIYMNPHFVYINGNPLDTRFDNMKLVTDLPRKEWEIYQKTKRAFIQNSVLHLLGLEQRMDKLGVDKIQLYEFLMLPNWLLAARGRKDMAPKVYVRNPFTRVRTTPEEADIVEKLYRQGLTLYAIMKRMNWTTNQRIKKIIKDRGLSR